jgi:Flavodoxin domain
MTVLVVYESMYGNTRAIAEAVAEGLGDVQVFPVARASERPEQPDLLVVGGPTRMHGLATSLSRRMSVEAAKEDGGVSLDPDAAAGPGLRRWLHELPKAAAGPAAAFDTRLDRSPTVAGSAARGIARRLRHRGYEVMGTESFLVEDAEGPLQEGEAERARAWGAELALGSGGPPVASRWASPSGSGASLGACRG